MIDKDKTDDFPVVGIGASAGGLEALESFFKKMPVNSGMAFVVIQHLSPDYKSLMAELLARHTKMPISQATDNMLIKPNNIYLIPPKKTITILNRHLILKDMTPKTGINLPIDIFFRSLAQDIGKLAFGIILSGTGSDGTLGIRAIKDAGGMVMAQDDVSAKFDGMPRSSIATGMVDFVAPPDEMPEALLKYLHHPYTQKTKDENQSENNESVLNKILGLIKEHVGVDFTFYKENTIIRRIEKRVGINQLSDFDEYLSFIESSPKEIEVLYKDLLIGVTQFFRDKEAFDSLLANLNSIFENNTDDVIRVWCVGCSTGEEAYSLGIYLNEVKEKHGFKQDIKIFATDLDLQHIEIASAGVYPESIVSDIDTKLLAKYFIRQNGYRAKEKLRQMIVFARQNIIKDPPFSKIDLISCRNMLIYLNQDTQKKVIGSFYFSLKEHGILFLGSSESLGDHKEGFTPVSHKWKIFHKKPGYNPLHDGRMIISNISYPSARPGSYYHTGSHLANTNTRISESILLELLTDHLESSLIINEQFIILHVFGEVNDFVKIHPGKINLNLLQMVSGEISVILTSMLNKASSENVPVSFKAMVIKGYDQPITISAKPVTEQFTKVRYFLISFSFSDNKQNKNQLIEAEELDINSELSKRYQQLEKDLQFSRENLQATIEELETSNEELQSTNEELVAANEELQSTNEELQSVNEELYTVNSEYQSKIEELTVLNNDMNNLLDNTHIGVLFLDPDLKIRKFTNSFSSVVNILESDLGRPIKHLSINMKYKKFISDIEKVLETLQAIENEVEDNEGNWFQMKIQPYRNENNAVEGVALTVSDINRIKNSEHKYRYLVDHMVEGIVYQNAAGEIVKANDSACNILGLTIEQLQGRTSMDPRWKAIFEDGSDFPGNKHPAMVALQTGEVQRNKIMGVFHPIKNEFRWIKINSRPIFDEGNPKPSEVFSTFEDITDQKNEQDKRKNADDLLIRTLENSPIGSMVVNKQGQITYVNPVAIEIMEVSRKSILDRVYNDIKWRITDPDGEEIPDKYLPFSLILQGEKKISRYLMNIEGKQKGRIPIIVHGSAVFDHNNQVDGAVFNIELFDTLDKRGFVTWNDFKK